MRRRVSEFACAARTLASQQVGELFGFPPKPQKQIRGLDGAPASRRGFPGLRIETGGTNLNPDKWPDLLVGVVVAPLPILFLLIGLALRVLDVIAVGFMLPLRVVNIFAGAVGVVDAGMDGAAGGEQRRNQSDSENEWGGFPEH